MKAINTLGIILNYEKEQSLDLTKKVIEFLENRGVEIKLPLPEAEALDLDRGVNKDEFCREIDCLLVVGGDGTFLRAARYTFTHEIPILGINMGQLGFLSEIEKDEIYEALDGVLAGEYSLEKRMMLEAEVHREGEKIASFFALNDFVINKGAFSRLISLKTFIGDEFVRTYSADGVIIATPTGSTAYSMSAGGPIVYPDLELGIITPVCPHSLSGRPMVISPEKDVKIQVCSSRTRPILTIDGQNGFELKNGDEIVIRKSSFGTIFVKLLEKGFFGKLRNKLQARDEE